MSFPTVKSDPWKKGLKAKRKRRTLWSPDQWKKLVEAAKNDTGWDSPALETYRIGPAVFALIRDFNGHD